MRWNSEKIQLVQHLWPTHSASAIAALISVQYSEPCTRNSAMGIAYRLGLCSNRYKTAGHLPENNIRNGQPRPKHRERKKAATVTQLKPAAPAYAPGPGNIQCPCQVIDLESHNCRWPFGDPTLPGFFFCGAVVGDGRSYCPPHAQEAYVPDKRMRGAA